MQAPAAAPLPEPVRIRELAAKLSAKFPGIVIDYAKVKRLKVTTTPDRMKEIAFFLRDQLGFDHIECVSGTDWIAKNEIEVIYFVGSVSRAGLEDVIIALAERPGRDNPVVPSLVEVWVGADYNERETFEMLGVKFEGHPNLRRLLLPEDWNDIPPLRKDFVSPGR